MPVLGDESDRGGRLSPPGPARPSWPPQPQPRVAGKPEAAEGVRKRTGTRTAPGPRPTGLFSTCSNPECASGWLHLLRKRSGRVFEGGWVCSAACTSARLEAAVRRETEGKRVDPSTHRHRVPLGLVMLEQGWISSDQLRQALDAQRTAGQGKLGQWLVRLHGVSEHLVARALSLQWSCAVLPLEQHDPEAIAPALPRLFVDAFGALPIRVAAGAILYLGFEERPDPVVSLALERMSGLRVEAGLVPESLFQSAHERMLRAAYPPVELLEAASESPLIRVLARAIERVKPVQAKLVRIHDCLWLRMWTRPQAGALPEPSGVEDVICSLATN
jgi:Type II secretion system (T2SS), protein E, N-terminal domain